MAQISFIKKSRLEGAIRIDPEYYKPEYLEFAKKLNSYSPLKDYTEKILHPTEIKRIYEDGGIQILLAQNIRHNYLDFSQTFFMSTKVAGEIIKNKLRKDDVVMTRSGVNFGDTAYYYKYPEIIYACADCLVIRPKNISGAYLSTFLNTTIGSALVKRGAYGTAQPHIAPKYLRELRIPRGAEKFEKEIESILEQSKEQFKLSELFYYQAEQMLLEELGLKNLNLKYRLFYSASLKETLQNNRIDAEYYNPVYEEMIKSVSKKLELLPLSEIFEFRRGVFVPPSHYIEEKTERPYIRIKELTGRVGINQTETIYINNDYSEDRINQIKENDLVIAIIGDTIGKTNKIPKELSGGFCSNNTGRLRIKSSWQNRFLPEISEFLFQSLFIQKQVEQKKAQTGQPKINDTEIKTIKIPFINASLQKKISLLLQQAKEKKDNAILLLEKAKKRVEDLIEGKTK